eukprot:609579-Ditylum_brightwellii.AAC.1
MTPDGHSWSPHSDAYACNEESLIDWEGNMIEKKDCIRILVEDLLDVDEEMTNVINNLLL